MRILHTGDCHLGDLNGPLRDGRNARREDTLECMRAIARTAAEIQPHVSIIAGDLFNRSRVWADTALDDIDAAVTDFIRPLCSASEQVVLLFGTANHDNPKAFNALRILTQGIGNLRIYTAPEVDTLETSAGAIQILAMPGFDKGRLRVFAPDADAETENQNATTLVNEIILGQAARLDPSKPSILVAHYTVAGCETENGQSFLAGQDVVILPQTIDGAGVTLGCFGHIHKPQRLLCSTPAFYCGSPNQLTFNDEGISHGFYIHEISGTQVTDSRFIQTPERKHYTLKLTDSQLAGFLADGALDNGLHNKPIADAIVRVYYHATAEQEKALNRAALQSELTRKFHAFYVADFIRDEAQDTLITDTATDNDPRAALHNYLTAMQQTDKKLTDADIKRLDELAEPIIRQADDGRDATRHTGAFIPRRIEVTNYRSYTHAEFDFTDIRMAMVNGPNGVGKSSLFMDSIADCLFESSRDGAKGEWVRQGEKKGAITFWFDMGGYSYRVARTRTKSKGTLALARKNRDTGEWENYGDTTMPLTQAKIIRTIGMDCQTFCSIALIRQDAYGLFLEAGSDQRMEVLSGLLNLGLYDRAEDIAKDKATEQRRILAALKDRMAVLEAQLTEKEQIEQELTETETEKERTASEINALEGQITALEREEALRRELIRQAQEKAQKANQMAAQAAKKEEELQKQRNEMEEASALADMADAAELAAQEVTQARERLESLAQDEAQLQTMTDRLSKLERDAQATKKKIEQLEKEKERDTAVLERKAEVQTAVQELETIRAERQALTEKIAEFDKAASAVAVIKTQIQSFVGESKIKINGIQGRLDTARKKAQLLQESGCPIAETASCEFLRDAQTAAKEVAGLEQELDETKRAGRKQYDSLQAQAKAAEDQLNGMSDPKRELQTLSEREQKAAPVAALAANVEAADARIAQIDRQTAEQRQALKDAESEAASIREQIKPLRESAETANTLRTAIKTKQAVADLQPKCAAAAATVKALQMTIDILAKDIDRTYLDANQAAKEAIEIQARATETPQTDSDALRHRLSEKKRELETITAKTGGLRTKLESVAKAKTQWEIYRNEKNEAAGCLADYQTLAASFGIDGIQYVIIRGVVPEIQSRANAILSAMTGGRMAVDFRTERENKTNSKIVNSLDVWITSLTGGCRPYSSHSGGEKVKIALAVTLALADVKARRAGVQLGMLWIDEPPFLDSAGTDAYADALTNMANRNPEMRILAISHDPQLKARFAQNITVSAGENGSEVSIA